MMITRPSSLEIKATRKPAGLTQTVAAALVHAALRTWQQWEAGDARMPAGAWELLQLKQANKPAPSSNKMVRALQDFIEVIDSTGGLYTWDNGQSAPAVDRDWVDLGAAYKRAKAALTDA